MTFTFKTNYQFSLCIYIIFSIFYPVRLISHKGYLLHPPKAEGKSDKNKIQTCPKNPLSVYHHRPARPFSGILQKRARQR